nr:hypothetical protein [Tanacetum cinerariifolium]
MSEDGLDRLSEDGLDRFTKQCTRSVPSKQFRSVPTDFARSVDIVISLDRFQLDITRSRLERHESLAPSSEFPLTPVVAPPEIRQRPLILVCPVRLFPSVEFITPTSMGCVNSSSFSSSLDSSSNIYSGLSLDSLSDSSSVHSSRCDASGLSHSGPSTRVASPRLVDPLFRTPRCSEAFMHWRSAPLSIVCPPTTSESSPNSSFERSLDSSSPSARPSRMRCRSPTTLVPSSTHVSRSIVPALVDLLPHKRFRDSYLPKVSREEYMEIGTADTETVVDLDISNGVRAPTKDGLVDPLVTGGIFKCTKRDVSNLEGTFYYISHYMSEVPLDRITEFETGQRQLEAGQLVASGERAGLADRVRSLGWDNLKVQALLCIEKDRVDSLRRPCHFLKRSFV